MKRFFVITLLTIAASSLALGQTESKKTRHGKKDRRATSKLVAEKPPLPLGEGRGEGLATNNRENFSWAPLAYALTLTLSLSQRERKLFRQPAKLVARNDNSPATDLAGSQSTTDKDVASVSSKQPRRFLSSEEVAKTPPGDRLSEPDSQPKPQEKDMDTPPMFGDFPIPFIPLKTQKPTVQGPISTARGQLKIVENESPVPQDRVFINYNRYSGFPKEQLLDTVHREIIGFEKTFLDKKFSIGLRLPLYQASATSPTSPGTLHFDGAFDLSIVLKYALIRNRETGT